MSEADTMDFTSTGEVVVNPERMHKGGTHAGSNWISRLHLENGLLLVHPFNGRWEGMVG